MPRYGGRQVRQLGLALDIEKNEASQQRVEDEYRAYDEINEKSLEKGVPAGLVGHATETQAAYLGRGRPAGSSGHVVQSRWTQYGGGGATGWPFQGRRVAVVCGLEALVGPVAAGRPGIVARRLLVHPARGTADLGGGEVVVVRLVVLGAHLGRLNRSVRVPAADGPLLVNFLFLTLVVRRRRTVVVGIDDYEGRVADVARVLGARLGVLYGVIEEGHSLLDLLTNLRGGLCRRQGQGTDLAARLQCCLLSLLYRRSATPNGAQLSTVPS